MEAKGEVKENVRKLGDALDGIDLSLKEISSLRQVAACHPARVIDDLCRMIERKLVYEARRRRA